MMKCDIDHFAQKFSMRSGIEFTAKSGEKDGYMFIDLHPITPEPPGGFSVRIHLFWKSFEISFVPDNFARSLIMCMGTAEGKKAFSAFAHSMLENSGKLEMRINGKKIDPVHPESWDKDWKHLDIRLVKFCDDKKLHNFLDAEPLIIEWGVCFLNMIISLLPLEEVSETDSIGIIGLPEGAIIRVAVNKYERNPVNRAACIVIHGCYCHICGIKFDESYGELGEGFIHVHHITPISEVGEGYVIDPANDLIPICPNCHSMLHRRNPPLTIAELKKFFKKV